MMLDSPGFNKRLSETIKLEIDKYCESVYDNGPRKHLGGSLIGHECKRYLWYVFRWCSHKKHEGRQQRLFNRGHREEARFIEWLRGIGFKVWEFSEDGNQIRISDCGGHFGGSLDGIVEFPERYNIPGFFLTEFKTNGAGKDGKGKKFDKLQDKGMMLEKYQHFAQTSTYGFKMNLTHALYLNINKNDDNIYIEIVKLDMKLGQQMISKANAIITTNEAPYKLSLNPTFFQCRFCDALDICHNNKPIDKNCRSCINASAVINSEWYCNYHQGVIPANVIPFACEYYQPIV